MIFARRFFGEGRTLRFSVERDARAGWEVRQEEDDRVVKVMHCHDWHRVEGMMAAFDLKAFELEQKGWRELAAGE